MWLSQAPRAEMQRGEATETGARDAKVGFFMFAGHATLVSYLFAGGAFDNPTSVKCCMLLSLVDLLASLPSPEPLRADAFRWLISVVRFCELPSVTCM